MGINICHVELNCLVKIHHLQKHKTKNKLFNNSHIFCYEFVFSRHTETQIYSEEAYYFLVEGLDAKFPSIQGGPERMQRL